MPNQTIQLRSKVLLPLGLVLCILLVLGFSSTYYIQKQALDHNIAQRIANARALFKELLKVEAELLGSLANNYVENEGLQSAFLADDRESLLTKALPLFNTIKNRNGITHLYFHRPDKICFLRVYNPERYGDKISRYTLDQAARLEVPTYGIELGARGTLTFRLVHPWLVNGKLIGFIELGKEIDQITPILRHMLNLELIFTIQKKHLNHRLWSEGKTLDHKPDNWEHFKDFVVVSSSFHQMSEDMGREISRHFSGQSRDLFNVVKDNRTYRGGSIPLIDASGIEVGDIFVFANYSNISSSRNLFVILLLLSALALSAFYALFTYYIGHIERGLQSSMHSLEEEIAHHRETARQLALHRDKLEDVARQQRLKLDESRAEATAKSSFLPICACCRKIRNDAGNWEHLETYRHNHPENALGNACCPECARKLHSESAGI